MIFRPFTPVFMFAALVGANPRGDYLTAPRDVRKSLIERPTESLLSSEPIAVLIRRAGPSTISKEDRGKYVAESPIKAVVAKGQAVPKAAASFANPKVRPGLVRWHKDFAAACAASQKSGKPVLLFQMMGKLDEQFC